MADTQKITVSATMQKVSVAATQQVVKVSPKGVPGPPGNGGGLPSGGNTGDVITKTALGASWQAPAIPWASTNW